MGDMVRKQIYLRKKQVQILRKRAEGSGVSESELIRRAIDEALYGTSAASRPDPSALEQIKVFIESLKGKKLEGQAIQFNRDEIYNERLERNGTHSD
ncbi:MAG TPA: CopG family transcriptional regulator [Anaerolineales bacterium]|nr:CopG family transcriptional regulator [Anaerolineales bacterium]